jgi:prokaryotic ubiquitin-like protein Pup
LYGSGTQVSERTKPSGVRDMATKDTDGGQQRATRSTEEVEEVQQDSQAADEIKERHEKLSDDVDSVLDEIDDVLEENAEDFVRSFVQKGGE